LCSKLFKEILYYTMFYWICQVTIFSIVLILLVHHIVHYLQSTLTVNKIKDLVNVKNQKYENILNVVASSYQQGQIIQQVHQEQEQEHEPKYTIEELLPEPNNYSMKDELKTFLKSQLNTNDTTEIAALEPTAYI